jgi:hypothetical protein
MKIKVYRILVPATTNDNNEFSIEHHQVWDKFVRKLVGGVTIMKSAKGQWLNSDGILYMDKMIPCDINCTKKQIKAIADFTKKHYNQEKIAYYKISNGMKFI